MKKSTMYLLLGLLSGLAATFFALYTIANLWNHNGGSAICTAAGFMAMRRWFFMAIDAEAKAWTEEMKAQGWN